MMVTGSGPTSRVSIMATAYNLVDYRTVEPVRRARLRVIEPAPAPATTPVAEAAPAAKLIPPAWMVAPPFRIEAMVSVQEPQAHYHAVPVPSEGAPYRSVREVPRAGC